jgi:2-polyprenyl-6-methoxyphenol hydroxylase-like FAD-dependent oxidoreductase
MGSHSRTTCCIAGGGPAGMMLGYLLARAGIEVQILEKHADFLHDFRGDTVHPSTLELMHELGVLEDLLSLPHQRVSKVRGRIGGDEVVLSDMTHLRTQCKFMVLMPQWNFLNFLAEQGSRFPTFHLKMQTEVTTLIEEKGRVAGIRAVAADGPFEIRADLVVSAEGRRSVLRERAGLMVDDLDVSIDMLWMRLSKHRDDPNFVIHANRGKALVTLARGEYWQCGLAIPKGSAPEMQVKGIEELRASIVENAPFLYDRVAEVRDWNDAKLLKVKVDRLRRWFRPGLICIGDAAHAMSPVGGVGINLAIQDAVATANILARPLQEGALRIDHLAKIQRRREIPTRFTQRVQAAILRQVVANRRLPWPLRLLEATTLPRRMRTRFVSVGIRPEHVETPDAFKVSSFGQGFSTAVPAERKENLRM